MISSSANKCIHFFSSELKVKQVSKHSAGEKRSEQRREGKKREKRTTKENRSLQKKIERSQKKVEQKLPSKGLKTPSPLKSDKEKKNTS